MYIDANIDSVTDRAIPNRRVAAFADRNPCEYVPANHTPLKHPLPLVEDGDPIAFPIPDFAANDDWVPSLFDHHTCTRVP